MLITQIKGGLGNQMFQYAIGRSLSIRNQTALRLDLDLFDSHRFHNGYELGRVFGIDAPRASEQEFLSMLGWRGLKMIRHGILQTRLRYFRGDRILMEPHFHYWTKFDGLKLQQALLSGYWQSPRYFLENAQQIKKDFSFKSEINHLNAETLRKIRSTNSVSVHVRRGDYVSNQENFLKFGTPSRLYYNAALELISSTIPDAQVFIFSDDAEYAKSMIKTGLPITFINWNKGGDSYLDMLLMSRCNHNVIANSTFSWWGAWLNENTNKIVVAPKRWFADERYDCSDIVPDKWLRM